MMVRFVMIAWGVILVIICPYNLFAQEHELINAILAIRHLAGPEELEESVIEHYLELYDNKLDLNTATKKQLQEALLLDEYQIFNLLEYREKYGNILSVKELSLLNGFGEEYCKALLPFIRLDSSLSQITYNRTKHLSSIRVLLSSRKNYSLLRYKLSKSNLLSSSFKLSLSELYKADNLSFYYKYNGKSLLSKFIVGDFMIKMAQGQSIWTSYPLIDVADIDNMIFNYPLFSPSNASISQRGVAAVFSFKSLELYTSLSFPDIQTFKSIARTYHNLNKGISSKLEYLDILALKYSQGNLSLNLYNSLIMDRTKCKEDLLTMEAKYGYGGFRCATEFTYNFVSKTYANSASALFSIDELNFGLLYSSHEKNEISRFNHMLRSKSEQKFIFRAGVRGLLCNMSFSVIDKKPNYSVLFMYKKLFYQRHNILSRINYLSGDKSNKRLSAKIKYGYENEHYIVNTSIDFKLSHRLSSLAYMELAYKYRNIAVFLSCNVHNIADWKDRIYVYERDAPYNFNLAMYSNRGYAVSSNINLHFDKIAIYLRCKYAVDYIIAKNIVNRTFLLSFQTNLKF